MSERPTRPGFYWYLERDSIWPGEKPAPVETRLWCVKVIEDEVNDWNRAEVVRGLAGWVPREDYAALVADDVIWSGEWLGEAKLPLAGA